MVADSASCLGGALVIRRQGGAYVKNHTIMGIVSDMVDELLFFSEVVKF
jgi:hypothetical protein